MEIKVNWYYIPKNSNDINDVVQVYEISVYGTIKFEYMVKRSEYDNLGRELPPKAFRACYKEHPTLNVLYSN